MSSKVEKSKGIQKSSGFSKIIQLINSRNVTWTDLSLPEFWCIWQIHTSSTATTSVKHKFTKRACFILKLLRKRPRLVFLVYVPLTTWSQTLTLSHTKQLWNLILGFFCVCAHLFVNKKCNGNREVLGSSQHEICPQLVSQTLLTAPEGLCSSQCGIVRRIWKLWQALPAKPHLMPVDTLLWLGLHLITEQDQLPSNLPFTNWNSCG